MKDITRIAIIILINFLIIFFILIVLDPFLDSSSSNYGINRSVLLKEMQPFSSYEIIPSDLYLAATDGLEKKSYEVQTDKNGYLIGSKINDADSTVTDIIFYGGSTTACLFVDQDSRFPFLIQRKLVKRDSGRHLIVINSGVSGNNTLHSLVSLVSKGIPSRPSVVVLMHNINDLTLLSKTGSYWDAPPTKAIILIDKALMPKGIKNRAFEFFRAVKNLFFPNLFERFSVINGKLAHWRYKNGAQHPADVDEFAGYRNLPKPDFKTIERKYKQMLMTFIKAAKANDIQVVMMTQFNRLVSTDKFVRLEYDRHQNNIDYNTFCRYYARFNDIIREISIQEGIFLIDLDRLVPKNKQYIYDAVHLNKRGSEFTADIISDKLTSNFPYYRK